MGLNPLLLASAPFPYAGEISAALSALLWGSAGIVIARITPPMSAGAINYGKNMFATVCFVALLWIISGSPLPQQMDTTTLWIFIASGFLGLSLCDTFLMRSLLDIGPQRMSLVFLAVPGFVAAAAILPPFSEHPPGIVWLGMAICLGGIMLAIRKRRVPHANHTQFRRGIRYAVIAAFFQAVSVLLARYGLRLQQVPLVDSAVVRMASGTVALLFLGAIGGRLAGWSTELRRPKAALMLFIAAFFGTFLGILSNQAGLQWAQHTGVAMTLNSLMPIYLLPLSVLFLGERFHTREVVATFIAVGGAVLMTWGSR